ncbi:MAG: sugar ABC transporter ATP-binding protein [Planctomycetota bacterium]|nr:sugar ABC transporter ATP-binding protein [Planctomycetota bacterium]
MTRPPLLEMLGVDKAFGATVALSGAHLRVEAGEVRALIGENGAGKSTLMRILSGVESADAGTIHIAGQLFSPGNPQQAREGGIAMVHQELAVVEDLSVEENLLLGREPSRGGLFLPGQMRDRVVSSLALLGREEIQPSTPVSQLSVAERQLVEIARALVHDAPVIVFDEPTSSLGSQDIEHLFEVIGRLRQDGRAVVYISHFLEEVQSVADTWTVLRDGEVVGEGLISETTTEDLVSQMIGRQLEEMYPQVPRQRGDVLIEVRDLKTRTGLRSADLTMHRGDVLGIAGLVGSGRSELLRGIYGLDAIESGSIELLGKPHRPDPTASIQGGVGLASEDRKEEGLAVDLSVATNLTLGSFSARHFFSILGLSKEREQVEVWIDRFGIRTWGPDQSVRTLSGGNQQKVALARLLHLDVDAVLLDEPTRGIDVGSKAEVYRWIGELAAQDKGVVVVSSSMQELLGICDRIQVMHRGVLGTARPVEKWDEHSLMVSAVGGEEAA